MTSKPVLIAAGCVALAVALSIAAWNSPQNTAAESEHATAQPRSVPAAPPAQAWFPEESATQPADSADTTPLTPNPERAAVVPPVVPPASDALDAETLKGTRWVDGPVDVEFMADGRWKMNGRICAQWVVEGSRVKIFDDKGEVHYVDIVGDTLEFNGKKIARGKS